MFDVRCHLRYDKRKFFCYIHSRADPFKKTALPVPKRKNDVNYFARRSYVGLFCRDFRQREIAIKAGRDCVIQRGISNREEIERPIAWCKARVIRRLQDSLKDFRNCAGRPFRALVMRASSSKPNRI